MAVTLNIDVRWSRKRIVHVRCIGLPLAGHLSGPARTTAVPLDHADLRSEATFQEFLRGLTWSAAHHDVVTVVAFEPELLRIPRLLGIEGEPADPLVIPMEEK